MCVLCDDSSAVHPTVSSRRGFLKLASVAAMGAALVRPSWAADPAAAPAKPGNVISPDEALARLMTGNARYVEGVTKRHDFQTEREALAGGQNPFACVLACSDSRIAPEYAFDTARGDLFVVRVAGNFATDDGIASFEYGLQFLGAPLILVLGHQKCGAVDATIEASKGAALPGRIPLLAAAIAPAVKAATGHAGDLLDNAIKENVRLTVEKLKTASPIIGGFVAAGKVHVVGGVYDLGRERSIC